MGFLKKLLGIGVTAGATVAAVRVSDKYKENNPNGVQDVNGDGKIDTKDVIAEVKKAATEVYNDAKENAPAYAQKAKDVANEAKNAAGDIFQTAKENVNETINDIKS